MALMTDDQRLDAIAKAIAMLTKEASQGSMGRLRDLQSIAADLEADRHARARIAAEP